MPRWFRMCLKLGTDSVYIIDIRDTKETEQRWKCNTILQLVLIERKNKERFKSTANQHKKIVTHIYKVMLERIMPSVQINWKHNLGKLNMKNTETKLLHEKVSYKYQIQSNPFLK